MPVHAIDSIFFKDLYGSEAMRRVFDDLNLLQKWLDFEAALARAEAHVGLVPTEAAHEITRQAVAAHFDTTAIKQGIDKTAHPLVSVIWQLSERCAENAGGYVHWGATTQDVMDTALVLQVKEALPYFEDSLSALCEMLAGLCAAHHDTPMTGRTHGQAALPITFGFKTAVWLAEVRRHRARLEALKPRLLVGQFSGAVGTLASVAEEGLAIQSQLMIELGLNTPDITWHTARDNFAEFATWLAMLSATLGKIAHEIIDLQKSDVNELEEPFEMGKVGSSTMPQKRNPMLCEAVLAIARLTRGLATTAIDAMLHEHERDWSSVQMEWAYLPELCTLTHGALTLMGHVLSGLQVYPERMLANLRSSGGLVVAERIMLTLGTKVGRQHAHEIVYEAAMRSVEERRPFADLLMENAAVTAHLTRAEIDHLLDPVAYTGLASMFALRVANAG